MIEKFGDGFRVTGTMLVADATALLEAGRSLLQGAGAGSVMVVDLSSVEETDSSALGVVFGLLRTVRQLDVALRIAHPPASMISLAALYGVSDSLPLA